MYHNRLIRSRAINPFGQSHPHFPSEGVSTGINSLRQYTPAGFVQTFGAHWAMNEVEGGTEAVTAVPGCPSGDVTVVVNCGAIYISGKIKKTELLSEEEGSPDGCEEWSSIIPLPPGTDKHLVTASVREYMIRVFIPFPAEDNKVGGLEVLVT